MDLPSSLKNAILVTGNPSKAEEAKRLLGIDLQTEAVDLPEIQSLDLREVLQAKGEEAWHHLQDRLQKPIIVDETGLELAALGGFPGPLVKWMLESVGAAGLHRTAQALGNPAVTARCALLYLDGDRSIVAEATVPGTLVEPRGDAGFGWDPIFLPNGETLTYAEMSAERKDQVGHRGKVWRLLAERLRGM